MILIHTPHSDRVASDGQPFCEVGTPRANSRFSKLYFYEYRCFDPVTGKWRTTSPLRIIQFPAVKRQANRLSWSIFAVVALATLTAFSEEVDFERTVRIVNSIKLDDTKIFFDEPAELIASGNGTADLVDYYLESTINNSFFLHGKDLFINGRKVLGFKAGNEYRYERGAIVSKDNKSLTFSDEFVDSGLERVSSIQDDERKISIKGIGIGGGTSERYARGFLIWIDSYVCLKMWNHEFYLWGVNYGRVDFGVEIDLKAQTVAIDKKAPVKIKFIDGEK